MRNFIKKVAILAFVLVFSVETAAILGVILAVSFSHGKQAESSERSHNIEVSTYDIRRELSDIAELMTYEYYYSGTSSVTDHRKMPLTGWNVPLTGHEIKMTYAGTIKIGYSLDDMEIDVDHDRKIISIKLGNQIIENNLPEEAVETIEKNNILNMIRADETVNRLSEIKESEYEKAKQAGICKLAQSNVEVIIKNTLSSFEEYRIQIKP